MISPNMNLASDSDWDNIEVGYDVSAKYYCVTQTKEIIHDGVHLRADKRLVMTVDQAKKLRDDLTKMLDVYKIHEKSKW